MDSFVRACEHQEAKALYRTEYNLLKFLLCQGFDVNTRDYWGRAMLFCVTISPAISRLLLVRGADLYAVDNEGLSVAKKFSIQLIGGRL